MTGVEDGTVDRIVPNPERGSTFGLFQRVHSFPAGPFSVKGF